MVYQHSEEITLQEVSEKPLFDLRELVIDFFVSFPYVVSDSALYFLNAVNFLDLVSDNESGDNKWAKPQYIVLIIMMWLLAITYFCTFSQSNSKFLNVEADTRWFAAKATTRRVLGIPSALTKTSIGSGSFFLSTHNQLGTTSAAIVSSTLWICSLPSQISILWSKFIRKNKVTNEIETTDELLHETIKVVLKYLAIHIPTFLYALSNASLYFWSTLNLPQRLGFFDHPLSSSGDALEKTGYYLTYLITAFPLVATYISYVHLNENMIGMTATESSVWTNIKSYAKKTTGGVASVAKVTNAGVATYSIFSRYTNKPLSIGIAGVCTISGLITQLSLLYNDPLHENEKREEIIINLEQRDSIEELPQKLEFPMDIEELALLEQADSYLLVEEQRQKSFAR